MRDVEEAQIGERVGALLEITDAAYLIGYGVRLEDEIPVENAIGFGPILNENGITNPTLLMDDGTKVYGCECWWASERHVKKMCEAAGKTILVNIDAQRKISAEVD